MADLTPDEGQGHWRKLSSWAPFPTAYFVSAFETVLDRPVATDPHGVNATDSQNVPCSPMQNFKIQSSNSWKLELILKFDCPAQTNRTSSGTLTQSTARNRSYVATGKLAASFYIRWLIDLDSKGTSIYQEHGFGNIGCDSDSSSGRDRRPTLHRHQSDSRRGCHAHGEEQSRKDQVNRRFLACLRMVILWYDCQRTHEISSPLGTRVLPLKRGFDFSYVRNTAVGPSFLSLSKSTKKCPDRDRRGCLDCVWEASPKSHKRALFECVRVNLVAFWEKRCQALLFFVG